LSQRARRRIGFSRKVGRLKFVSDKCTLALVTKEVYSCRVQNGRCRSLPKLSRQKFPRFVRAIGSVLFLGCTMALVPAFAEIPQVQEGVAQSEAAAPSEALSHETIERTRAEFIESLYLASKHRQLTVAQTQHPGFQRFVGWFQQKH